MSRPPHGPDNYEEQQRLQQQQEAYRLKQEKRRLEMARRRVRLAWVRNTIVLFLSVLQGLLALRFFLRLSGANPDNPFANVVYRLAAPFMAPFNTLFVSPTTETATHIFDVNNIMAMIVYALLGALAIALVNYLQGPNAPNSP